MMGVRVPSLLLLLLACAVGIPVVVAAPLPETADSETARTWVYRCADDVSVLAQVRHDEAMVWFPQAGYQVLPQAMAASGNKFSKGDLTLWTRDGKAFIREGEITYLDCNADHRAAVWEGAKLRGVQFRATGNEPGWFLELNPSTQQLVLVTAYGRERLVASLPAPEVDEQARTSSFRAASSEGEVVVTIQGKPCQDSMSGEEFEARVVIQKGEKSFQGCGRALY